MTDAREVRAARVWTDEVCAAYPALPHLVARLGSPPIRWYVEPTQKRDNAYFIDRVVITFPDGALHEDHFLEVQLRDQDYGDSLLRYVCWHESGHILARLMGAGGRYRDISDVYERYNRSRSLPGGVVTSGNWSQLTAERFADDFWAAHDPSYDPQNGPQPAAGRLSDPGAMRSFFRALVQEYSPVIENLSDPAGYLLRYPITRGFGDMSYPQYGPHTGIDFGMPAGAKIPAVRAGYVVLDDDQAEGLEGISVKVRSDDGELWWYAHLERNLVTSSERVERGRVIGSCGQTGAATGPHLHLERQVGGQAVDGWEELVMLSEEAKDAIRQIVREETAKVGASIETKLNAGFNETAVAIGNRIVAGDKDVGTAAKE